MALKEFTQTEHLVLSEDSLELLDNKIPGVAEYQLPLLRAI